MKTSSSLSGKRLDTAEIEIRPMRDSDLDAVEIIERDAFRTPWSRGMLAGELIGATSHPFSVCFESVLVGYLFLWHVADECHLINIAVVSEHRRKGLGRILIEFAVDWARERGCSAVLLEVRESNRAAISLYRKVGFQEVGVRKNYYRSGPSEMENAVLMTCLL